MLVLSSSQFDPLPTFVGGPDRPKLIGIGTTHTDPQVINCLRQLATQQGGNGGFVMKRLILIPLSFLWAQAALAAPPAIVDCHYVAEAIARNAVVWDVRDADAYAKGHITGAISTGGAAKVLRDGNTEDFLETARIEEIHGEAG